VSPSSRVNHCALAVARRATEARFDDHDDLVTLFADLGEPVDDVSRGRSSVASEVATTALIRSTRKVATIHGRQ